MAGKVAAVVLAAGEASRFGAPKQLLLLPRVLERLRLAPVDEIVVVEGAHPLGPCGSERTPGATAVSGADSGPLAAPPCRVVSCPAWRAGPGASLRCGLAALGEEVVAAVVVLADGPALAPEAIARVVATWRREGGTVAASYGGERGHPLVLGREEWASVPDEGLRDRPVRLVACDDLGAPGDIDRPEDLPAELRNTLGTP